MSTRRFLTEAVRLAELTRDVHITDADVAFQQRPTDNERPGHPLLPLAKAWQERPNELEPETHSTRVSPNDADERVSTGFVESAVNAVGGKRLCKRQQMRWSKLGAVFCYRPWHEPWNRKLSSYHHRCAGVAREAPAQPPPSG